MKLFCFAPSSVLEKIAFSVFDPAPETFSELIKRHPLKTIAALGAASFPGYFLGKTIANQGKPDLLRAYGLKKDEEEKNEKKKKIFGNDLIFFSKASQDTDCSGSCFVSEDFYVFLKTAISRKKRHQNIKKGKKNQSENELQDFFEFDNDSAEGLLGTKQKVEPVKPTKVYPLNLQKWIQPNL
jgi:hypothetical protein